MAGILPEDRAAFQWPGRYRWAKFAAWGAGAGLLVVAAADDHWQKLAFAE